MSAAPNAVNEFQRVGDTVDVDLAAAGPALAVNPKATSAAIASSFKIMNKFWVVLPARTPRQLMMIKITSAIVARTAARLSFAFGRLRRALYPPFWFPS